MSIERFTIRHEGPRVQLIVNGVLVADLPPNAARELAAAMKHQAGRAEEVIERDRIVFDEAVLLRAGLPTGLIFDPYLRHQAEIEAQHNTTIRRSNMGAIQSREHFGVPAIIRHAPRTG